jgi:nitrite reductase (NADH) small subunit
MSAVTSLPLVSLCALDDLPVGLGRSFRVGGELVAVFRSRAGRVFAVAGACPHRGGPLADGMLAGERVVCPLHAFRYDAATGACDQADACAVRTYPVEVIDGRVCMPLRPE